MEADDCEGRLPPLFCLDLWSLISGFCSELFWNRGFVIWTQACSDLGQSRNQGPKTEDQSPKTKELMR